MNDGEILQPVISPLLAEHTGKTIRHGFFTRQGGVSQGLYRGLNVGLGSDDNRAHVLENRRRVTVWFSKPPENLATMHQVHSADVAMIGPDHDGTRQRGDAMVTKTPGMILGVLAADCGPVLFADPQNRIVGAAHAGWKGAFDGVLEATINAMTGLGADRGSIVACLGPSISRHHYEVGPEFIERFVTRDTGYARYFDPSEKAGHAMFDLPAFTCDRLQAAGIRAENLDLCTYKDEDRFYSYRRTTHRNEPDYGRQIAAIMIEEN